MKKVYLSILMVMAFGTTAHALPSLQLGGDGGNWTYVAGGNDTWYTSDNPFNLLAFANATAANGGNGDYAWETAGATDRYAYLVFAAVPSPGSNTDLFNITVSNDGGNLSLFTSGYGTPPIEDPNSLAPHGIYASYYEIYEFQFDGALTDIYNTQPGDNDTGKGYKESFLVNVNGIDPSLTGFHMDLFTVFGDGQLDLGSSNRSTVEAFAPYSHDAEYTTGDPPAEVPEPGTLLLFGTGLMGLAGWSRRSKK